MRRIVSACLLFFCVAFSLTGCAAWYRMNGVPQEEIEKGESPVLWQKVQGLEQQDQVNQTRDAALAGTQAAMKDDLDGVKKNVGTLQGQVTALSAGLKAPEAEEVAGEQGKPRESGVSQPKGVIATLDDRTTDLQQRVARIEASMKGSEGEGGAAGVSTNPIKVLSGTGNLAAAKKMTAQLGKLGYRVARIDKAPRKDFKENIVYYSASQKDEAVRLAKQIGGKTIVRPLTWKSRFNMIVLSVLK